MLMQLLTPDYIVFTAAFVLMIGIGVVEAIGLGIGHLDFDTNLAEPDATTLLSWLGLGRGLPILIWLTCFLACFTFIGLVIQQLATLMLGSSLHWSIAVSGAIAAGLVANAFVSGLLAGVMPEYESTVIDSADLLRRRATVLEGAARRGSPARAKVTDYHGQAHYVMVEPHDDDGIVTTGETGLLVRKQGLIFFIMPESGTSLTSL